jgi:hypothetical protein
MFRPNRCCRLEIGLIDEPSMGPDKISKPPREALRTPEFTPVY